MSILFNNELLVVNPKLATIIGLNEAIVLQQMNYWIVKSTHSYDGKKWVYNSVVDWSEQFPFFSEATIKRAIKSLEDKRLLFIGNYNKDGRDRTKWYSINHDKLDEFVSNALGQNDQMQSVKMTKCIGSNCTNALGQNDQAHQVILTQPLPETTTETTTDINLLSKNSVEFQDDDKVNHFLTKNPEAHIFTPNGKKWGTATDLECAKWMYKKILDINSAVQEPNWTEWSNDIRLLRTQLKISHKDIGRVFKWANLDQFWQCNILCPIKLRKQWNILTTQMLAPESKTKGYVPKPLTDTDWVEEAAARMGII